MPETLRDLSLRELHKRKAHNPAYSLRAFARSVAINPTSLSLFLNARRALSKDAIRRLYERLRPGEPVPPEILDGEEYRADYEQLADDQLEVVSDWFYYAVLSLMETRGFRDEPKWVARRLGITTREASAALTRLERLGMARRNRNGKLAPTGRSFATSTGIPSDAVRTSHRQALDLAKASLERDGVDRRNFSAMTLAIDPARLPEAARRIERFRRSLTDLLEKGERTEVYRLAIQLFPLSQAVEGGLPRSSASPDEQPGQ